MEFNIPENIGLVPTAVHSAQLGAEAQRKLATDINDLWSMHIQAQNTVATTKDELKVIRQRLGERLHENEAVAGTTRTQRPMVIIPAGTRNSDGRPPTVWSRDTNGLSHQKQMQFTSPRSKTFKGSSHQFGRD